MNNRLRAARAGNEPAVVSLTRFRIPFHLVFAAAMAGIGALLTGAALAQPAPCPQHQPGGPYGLLEGLQPAEILLIADLLRSAPDGTQASWTNKTTATDYAISILDSRSVSVTVTCRAYTITATGATGVGEAYRMVCGEAPVHLTAVGAPRPNAGRPAN